MEGVLRRGYQGRPPQTVGRLVEHLLDRDDATSHQPSEAANVGLVLGKGRDLHSAQLAMCENMARNENQEA